MTKSNNNESNLEKLQPITVVLYSSNAFRVCWLFLNFFNCAGVKLFKVGKRDSNYNFFFNNTGFLIYWNSIDTDIPNNDY